MNAIAVGAVIFVVLATAIGTVQFGLRRVYNYALTPTHFEVRLFGLWPIYHISLREIAGVAPWRLSAASIASAFVTLSVGNRIFGPALVLERTAGFPRYVVVTPDDATGMLVDFAALSAAKPHGR